MPAIQQWQVYHVPICRHAKPQPKNKFIVIACIDETPYTPYGFFVNTNISRYIRKRARLLPCEVPILSAEHSFLSYDSWIDCQEAYPYLDNELTDYKCMLSSNTVSKVIQAAQDCPVLKRRIKKLILST